MSLPQKTATAPEVIGKNTLPGLPKELLEAIAKECDPSDLLALRQASRLVHNGIDRTFLHEYFTDRNHIITVGSLEDLIHITATPRMCKTLSRLTLSMPWLEQRYWGPDPKAVCSSPCMREDHSSND
ncbi:hypothetical protein M409DRAFT_19613 [Zasmidium cellare ATCC 36951]|uniref:F-box domain-containing protein n=1 Tax=Zasmidium cellare ATCC 36951 TaxID=1080233 RepID=A0A6A6CUY0_ZASCE|nr:uncharacterized protein M409DRAFT_19613 [Zasmidium cellare ATCC 36951]KAF2169998.1 hypothetical protein M409DRAFT_19613 [Zasmidium cellare ATCC 36951]